MTTGHKIAVTPEKAGLKTSVIPEKAGLNTSVIPAKAGIQSKKRFFHWIPAYAGMTVLSGIGRTFLVVFIFGLLPALAADSSNPAIEVLAKAHEAGAQNQARIDKLDDAMKRLRDEMRQGALKLESLKAEMPQLQQSAGSTAARRQQLEREFSAGVPGQIEVQPSLHEMVDWLEKFVAADSPFRRAERRQRVAGLRGLLDKEKVSDADKLRAVLEVVQVELQYGRSVSVYTDQLRFNGKEKDIEFLRVGRLMLYYLEPDGTRQGYWDRSQRRWQPLPVEAREQLMTAMAMARGEIPPELMELRLPAPEKDS